MPEHVYRRPDDRRDGLRLHFNENTGGCSPRVLEALAALAPDDVAFYPDYARATAACAEWLGLPEDEIVLTNGLDEGILACTVAALRDRPGADAVIPVPTFEEYAACVDAVGGRVVTVPPRRDFAFPLEDLLRALTDATRLIFLATPNNPTGQLVPHEAIRVLAARAPEALIVVDEAYAEFAGRTFLAETGRPANVVIGRTFAKSFGLAALRIGALAAAPATLASIRPVLPPYSLNVCAIRGLLAALSDLDHMRGYLDEVVQSKALLYAACDRLGLAYWRSAANFVLIRVGSEAPRIVQDLAARGIIVRDRSRQPGCAGCIRITTGIVAHTEACIRALEEVL
jgi:histidinol-phosphate aminotransferase